ncbi:hypothetical protein VTJ04DRAFT_9817 [Mycothermus thermophilus]|uniref:uncharacterized protein n=1 Tax=Humicola insolens TaxID=85995 RepID=UPI0037435FF4
MSSQPKPSKSKGKGARRVSNLSEEQRNKKRENDRIAQQNIRRRNKELIERLQREVELLRRLNQVDMTEALLRRNRVLEEEVQALRRAFHLQTGREYPLPSAGADADGIPPGEFGGDYAVQPSFGSPYIAASNIYSQWPSNVVPVTSAATAHSVTSSPGASVQGDDFTHGYAHSSLPPIDQETVMGSAPAPALGSILFTDKSLPWLGSSSAHSYPGSSTQQHSPPYLHEHTWASYQGSSYYTQPTTI